MADRKVDPGNLVVMPLRHPRRRSTPLSEDEWRGKKLLFPKPDIFAEPLYEEYKYRTLVKKRIDDLFDRQSTLFFFLYLGIAFGIGALACILGR